MDIAWSASVLLLIPGIILFIICIIIENSDKINIVLSKPKFLKALGIIAVSLAFLFMVCHQIAVNMYGIKNGTAEHRELFDRGLCNFISTFSCMGLKSAVEDK